MIQLTNICKSFTDGTVSRMVLRNLSLEVADGDFLAITGESGVGKTTLLSILGTLLMPDSGSYRLDGIDVLSLAREGEDALAELRNSTLGIVFQDHRLLPQFTAMQNILLPDLARCSKARPESVEYAAHLMEFMGVGSLAHQSVETLSGGEKARVAICRALIHRPSLLLADEPTGQLDAHNSRTIAELFCRINEEMGTTIVMVTHSGDLASVASRRIELQ